MKKLLLLLLFPIFCHAQTIKIRYVDSAGMEQIATFTLPHSAISGKFTDLNGAPNMANYAPATAPVLVNPNIGAATATSLNTVIITTPASPAILTVKGGTTISNLASFTFDSAGSTTLIAGTKAVTVTGITASSIPILTLQSQGGTVTTIVEYKAVCTTNTLTITAVTSAKATNTTDTSTVGYLIVN